jgi:hypothetical protein
MFTPADCLLLVEVKKEPVRAARSAGFLGKIHFPRRMINALKSLSYSWQYAFETSDPEEPAIHQVPIFA